MWKEVYDMNEMRAVGLTSDGGALAVNAEESLVRFPPHVRHVKKTARRNLMRRISHFLCSKYVKDLPILQSSRPPTARDVIDACTASYASASCVQFIAYYYGFVCILMRRFPATSDGSDACREVRNLGILAVAPLLCTNAWYRVEQR